MVVEDFYYKMYPIGMDNMSSNFTRAEITRHIANKIVLLRRNLNLTQECFAEQIGLSTRAIQRAEGGTHRPTQETLEKIAKKFNIPIRYFYDNSTYSNEGDKQKIIEEINSELNVYTLEEIIKLKKILEIIKE